MPKESKEKKKSPPIKLSHPVRQAIVSPKDLSPQELALLKTLFSGFDNINHKCYSELSHKVLKSSDKIDSDAIQLELMFNILIAQAAMVDLPEEQRKKVALCAAERIVKSLSEYNSFEPRQPFKYQNNQRSFEAGEQGQIMFFRSFADDEKAKFVSGRIERAFAGDDPIFKEYLQDQIKNLIINGYDNEIISKRIEASILYNFYKELAEWRARKSQKGIFTEALPFTKLEAVFNSIYSEAMVLQAEALVDKNDVWKYASKRISSPSWSPSWKKINEWQKNEYKELGTGMIKALIFVVPLIIPIVGITAVSYFSKYGVFDPAVLTVDALLIVAWGGILEYVDRQGYLPGREAAFVKDKVSLQRMKDYQKEYTAHQVIKNYKIGMKEFLSEIDEALPDDLSPEIKQTIKDYAFGEKKEKTEYYTTVTVPYLSYMKDTSFPKKEDEEDQKEHKKEKKKTRGIARYEEQKYEPNSPHRKNYELSDGSMSFPVKGQNKKSIFVPKTVIDSLEEEGIWLKVAEMLDDISEYGQRDKLVPIDKNKNSYKLRMPTDHQHDRLIFKRHTDKNGYTILTVTDQTKDHTGIERMKRRPSTDVRKVGASQLKENSNSLDISWD